MAHDGIKPLGAALATVLSQRACCEAAARTADAAALVEALPMYCSVLEALWQGAPATEVIAALPEALRLDACAYPAWREVLDEYEQAPDFVLALWCWQTGGDAGSANRPDQRRADLRNRYLRLHTRASYEAAVTHADNSLSSGFATAGLGHAEAWLAAGESAAGVREQALWLFVNAGASAADPATRHALYLRGLGHAEAWLAAGESAAGVRERALTLFVNAGVSAADPATGHALYLRGLGHAEAWLAAGESAAGVRERALTLFVNAGVSAADPATQHALYLRGLGHAEAFLAAGESAAGVREHALRLFLGAGLSAADPATGHALYLRGLGHAEAFLAAGESAAGVREQALWLFVNAGFSAADPATGHALYLRGLDHAEAFLAAGESAAGVRERALRLFGNAGFSAADPATGHALYLRGLGHAEAFLAAGESAAGVRDQALLLFGNVGAVFNLQKRPDTSLAFWIQQWTLAWCAPYAPHSSGQQAGIERNHEPVWSMLRARPAGRLLTLWHDALRNWLTRQQPATVAPADRRGLWQRMQMAHALLALDSAAAGAGFTGLYRRLADAIAAIEQPRQQQRRRLDEQVSLGLEGLQAQLPRSLDVSDAAAVRNWLAEWQAGRSFWKRLWHAAQFRRLQSLLDQRQALTHAGHGPAAQLAQQRRRLDWCEAAVIDWLAAQVLRHCGLPAALDTSAGIALGLLFASQTESADADVAAVLRRWQQQAPWQSAADCAAAWPATRPQHWTLFDDGARAALYVWLQHWPELKVDDQLANGAGSDLDAALRAWADGDAQPLCGLLHGGWQAAQEPADKLGRCLSALQPALAAPDLRACSEGPAAVDHAVRIDALAAVLCGRAQARLAQALRDWLDAQCPLPAEGLDDALLARVRRRFSRLCSLHPGPPAQHELGERLHGWAQQWLGAELAAARPQPEAIWQALELARIGLNGLRTPLPDADWHEATAEAVREALLNTKALPPGPGLFWPPLQRWFGRLDAPGGLPRLPEVETCRRRLRTGEALVQVLFDPGSGRQLALWLDTRQPLRLRAFPAPANHAAWREGALALWQQWAADEHSQGLARLWPTLIADPAVQVTAATLAGWAAEAGLERLIVIWPASLAQLPWEAFAPFVDGAPGLERAVNLGDWRTASAREPAKAWVAHFADSAHGGFAIEAMAADSARFWQVDAQPCGIQAASGFDVLGLLHGGGAGHLIVHGEYRPDEPRRSRLQIATGEYLPAWTLGALGIGCPLLWLSACQANLSGRATRERLGPVGLGPTLIAAGAQRVLGALWKCDTLAAWLLHRFLHEAIAEAAGASPQARYWHALREARERLRALRGSEVEALLRAELGEAVFGERRYEFDDYLLPDRPFDNPYYWAAFVLLGEPDAVAD